MKHAYGWIPGLLAAVLLLGSGGCASSRPHPPAARAEARPERPATDAVWVPGHWQWTGRKSGYRWVAGHWAPPGVASRQER